MNDFFADVGAIFSNPYIALIFLVALGFDFINGFHDAANSIATIVGTRVLKPLYAVFWAAFWNFVAAWVFGIAIANTIAKWINTDFITPDVIFAGLLGAIIWDIITWRIGLPTSSSHALLGGFAGAALTHAAKFSDVLNEVKVFDTIKFIFIAPLIGFILGAAFLLIIVWLARKLHPSIINRWSRRIQLISAAAYSLGHGTNDAQKTMGVIAALLYASIWKDQQDAFTAGAVIFPFWIVLICHLAMALGTMAGGWRIVKTMAMKLTKLKPYQGACAESAAAISLFTSAELGIPVSTTHAITGAIVGVGSMQSFAAVRWGLASRVLWTWIFTIPASAIAAALCYYLVLITKAYL